MKPISANSEATLITTISLVPISSRINLIGTAEVKREMLARKMIAAEIDRI